MKIAIGGDSAGVFLVDVLVPHLKSLKDVEVTDMSKSPTGASEYYADMDCIVDDQLWKPEVWEGAQGLYSWGPPVPPSFLSPDDLAELMSGRHG